MFVIHYWDDAAVIELPEYPCVGEERLRYRAVLLLLARKRGRLILNCARVRFFGASFLGLLLRTRQVMSPDTEVILCCLPPHAEDVLRVTRLEGYWPVRSTVEEALLLSTEPLTADESTLVCTCCPRD